MTYAFRAGIDARFDTHGRSAEIRIEALRQTMESRFDAQMEAVLRVEQVMDARLRLPEQQR